MMSEKFAYRQERTSFIISQLPSYMCAIKRGESNEFFKFMMGEFIARFPMDLAGVPQPGPLRLANIDHFELRHPDQMVKAAMKAHINVSIVFSSSHLCTVLTNAVIRNRICEKNG